MSVKFTPSQTDAINASGTVLVAAAAGSGKTAVLVERIIRRFCDETAPLMADRALIVTFTNAAAAELKSKIETALKKKLYDEPGSDLLKRQNMAFKRATICTIDSFCISLLRENFNLLDISRDFKINDSTNLDAELDLLLDKFIFQRFSSKDEVLMRAVDSLKSGFDEWYLKKIIKTLYNKSRSMPYPDKWLDGIFEMYREESTDFSNSKWTEYVFSKLSVIVYNALISNEKLYNYCIEGTLINNKYVDSMKNRVDFLRKLISSCKTSDWNACITAYTEFINPALRRNYSKDPMISALITESNDSIKECIEFIKSNFDSKLEDIEYILSAFSDVLMDVVEIVKDFDVYVFEHSKQKNSFTFDQIEHLALNLFSSGNNTAIENFNSMFDAILVDEYQDTSNLQDELFALLSNQKKELFMVGDVKQSIYGFRNANPDNFLRKKDTFPEYRGTENPCKVLLTGNFRSRKGICDFINYIFTAYMTKSEADMDYNSDEALVSLGKFAANSENTDVEIKLIQKHEDLSAIETEANYIADYIIDTLEKEPFIDDGNNGLRKVEFSDFALLMLYPSSRINTFVEVFKQRGIPVNHPTGSFKDSSEIKTILSYLRIIENINDEIAMLTVLKSSLYNFNDEEIAEIVSADRYLSLYNNLRNAEKTNSKVERFMSQLDRFRMYHALVSLDKLLNMIYSETLTEEIYSSFADGDIKIANLRNLLEISRKFTIESGKGINELVDYVESDSSNSLAVSLSNAQSSVEITSIHKSKGLQYPICILCSANTKFVTRDITSSIVCDDKLGTGFSFYDKKYNSQLTPISKKIISDGMKSKLFKEELRLLYVALTRAKDKLVVVSTVKDTEKYLEKMTVNAMKSSVKGIPFTDGSLTLGVTYSDWLITAALVHKDGVAFRRGSEDFECSHYACGFSFSVEAPDFSNAKTVTSDKENSMIEIVDFEEISAYKYPYSSVNSVPAKTSVTEILKSDDTTKYAFKARPSFISDEGLTAAEKGTATHKFMEYCNFDSALHNIEAEIERLYEWEFISQNEADAIDRESVTAFFKSYAFGLILKGKKIHKEYRFITKIPANQLNCKIKDYEEYSVVQGVADCIVVNENDLVIIDYKTDSSQSEEYYINEYQGQLKLYSEALSRIFKKPVSKCILYSFKMQKCIEV